MGWRPVSKSEICSRMNVRQDCAVWESCENLRNGDIQIIRQVNSLCILFVQLTVFLEFGFKKS